MQMPTTDDTSARIVIVDDEADIRELVAGILQDEGYGTRTAADADEALGAVVARRPNRVPGACPIPVRPRP